MIGFRPILGIAMSLVGLVGCRNLSSPQGTSASAPGSTTYAGDVAPILFTECAPCHHPGGSAPFSVLDYKTVRTNARQIAAETVSRRMPPWLPEPGYGELAGVRRLADDQIDTIRRWVEQGMVEGNPAALPPAPQFSGEWQLGQPDLIVKLPRPYTLPSGSEDVFRNFVIPIPIAETRPVRTVEIRPGSARFVHHGLIAIDETRSSRLRDQQDTELGFGGMDMGDAQMPDGSLLGWSPGMLPFPGIEGATWNLKSGSDLVLQLHMMPAAQPQVVDPVVGFHFAKTAGAGPPTYVLMLDADWALDIPAGANDFVVSDTMKLPVDVEVLVVYPHAHYVGKSVEGWASLPDGTRQWLIRIPRWDFKWQDVYRLERPLALPKGTELTMRWTYDNSSPHPLHADHAPVRVVAGNRTTDEMAHLQLQVRLRTVQDRFTLEEAFFRHRLEKKPDSPRFLYGLATALKDQGRWAEAASRYRAALAVDPSYVLAHNNLGAVLMEQGRIAEAMSEFQEALRLDPDLAGAHYNLGIALGSRGDLNGAVSHYREALRHQTDFGEAHDKLGLALGALGHLDEALPHLREAVRLVPESADAHNNLGTGLWFQGKADEAVTQFRRALEINPNHPSARKNLSAALKAGGSGDRGRP